MIRSAWATLVFFLSISAMLTCGPGCSQPLERKSVPVWAGISIDSATACPGTLLRKNLHAFEQYALRGCVVEIPLTVFSDKDPGIFTYYESHGLDTIISLLKPRQLPYVLHFQLRNPFEVPAERFRLASYLTDISGLLLRTSTYPPQQIIFSGGFLDSTLMQGHFPGFLQDLREYFTPFQGEIVLAGKPEEILDPLFPWEWADAVGVTYAPPAEENFKTYFRSLNKRLSKSLLLHQKPVVIVQSNLLGENKTLQFRNQLRFWEKEVELRWINLNTLYCNLSLSDTLSYFALGKDREFQSYLQSYLAP